MFATKRIHHLRIGVFSTTRGDPFRHFQWPEPSPLDNVMMNNLMFLTGDFLKIRVGEVSY